MSIVSSVKNVVSNIKNKISPPKPSNSSSTSSNVHIGSPTSNSPSGTYITSSGGVSYQAPSGSVGAQVTKLTNTSTGRSGGGSSSGGSSNNQGVVIQTPQGGVSYPSQAIAQTAQQKLDAAKQNNKIDGVSDTYGKSADLYKSNLANKEVGYYSGGKYYASYNDYVKQTSTSSINPATPLGNPIKRFFAGLGTKGNKPLTEAEKLSLSKDLGLPQQIASGTIINTADRNFQGLTKYDYANTINTMSNSQVNAIIKDAQEQGSKQLEATKGSLQSQVNSGLISVDEANKQLQQTADSINMQIQNNVNPKIASIEYNRNQKINSLGLSQEELAPS